MIIRVQWIAGIMGLLCLAGAASSSRRVTTAEGISESSATVPKEWMDYLDPAKDDFWREGNHVPDQGFLLWAKNPTKENARLYLIRMNMKRNLLHLMQEQQKEANLALIKEGVIADDYDFLSSEIGHGKIQKADTQKSLEGLHLFFFFSPSCPNSQKQASMLKGLQNVTPLQVSGQELLHFPELPESVWAEKEDMEKYRARKGGIILIYQDKTKKFLQLSGFQSLNNITKAALELKK